MKKQIKDPRKNILICIRILIFAIVILPFIYFNIKSQNINNLLFFIALLVILFIFRKKFKVKQNISPNTTLAGFVFFGILLLLASMLSSGIFIFDFLEKGITPSISALLTIFTLLLFSFIFLYLSIKSKIYEKKILKINKDSNYRNLLYFYLVILFGFNLFLLFLRYGL